MSPLLVVTGTGTEIGKTHTACALASAWGRSAKVAAVKPIESGGTADGDALGRVSTFHVTRCRAPYMYAHPVSPHLAGRREGRPVDLAVVADWVASFRREADGVLVELAGGLFSPVTESATNADLAKALAPTAVLLVAPDRLGVLHDVGSATRAARSEGLALHGVLLSAPAAPDSSTGTNAAELRLVTDLPVLAVYPRASVEELAARADTAGALRQLLSR
jgi:dethiobiotin synthetase